MTYQQGRSTENDVESLDWKFKDGYFENPSLNCYIFFSILSYLLGYTVDPSFSTNPSFSSLIVALHFPFSLSFSLSGRGRHGWMWTTSFTPMTSPPHVPPSECHLPHLREQLWVQFEQHHRPHKRRSGCVLRREEEVKEVATDLGVDGDRLRRVSGELGLLDFTERVLLPRQSSLQFSNEARHWCRRRRFLPSHSRQPPR